MPLTAFGKAIRRARLDTGHTQTSMAFELGTSASYLSALENGAKTISDRWLNR
ncbi:helix-turn-helix domain-containing protein, partial [Burkholderia ambifaria]|uniref:helix-turn-helix domain-containing protein n=1 Tax=Burkholderia ambifaria TaxID=152480 RepID=UPI000B259418